MREFLAVERSVVPLHGETLDDAVAALLQRLVEAGVVRDAERLARRVAERRPEDLLAPGGRAYIAHFRTEAADDLAVAIGAAPRPLLRAPGEPEPRAQVVMVVVAPPKMAARHLQVVRGFARLLAQAETVESITAVESAAALLELPVFTANQLPTQLTVRDVMSERPRTTRPDVELSVAARELIRSGLVALPVVDAEDRFLGLLSERELMRHYLTSEGLARLGARPSAPTSNGERLVRDVMSRQVLCVPPELPVSEVASLMTHKNVERVPVVTEGRLVGFLTRGDIVRKLIGI